MDRSTAGESRHPTPGSFHDGNPNGTPPPQNNSELQTSQYEHLNSHHDCDPSSASSSPHCLTPTSTDSSVSAIPSQDTITSLLESSTLGKQPSPKKSPRSKISPSHSRTLSCTSIALDTTTTFETVRAVQPSEHPKAVGTLSRLLGVSSLAMSAHHDTAADLLRQALQNRPDDDHQDHILPTGSTPGSGIVTPQPDPSDKRTPGIMHSYFGQVRASFSTGPDISGSTALVTPSIDFNIESEPPLHRREGMDPSACRLLDGKSSHEGSRREEPRALPTPPDSSNSSLHNPSKSEDTDVDDVSLAAPRSTPVEQKGPSTKLASGTSSSVRRHTSALLPTITPNFLTSSPQTCDFFKPTCTDHPSTDPSTPAKATEPASGYFSTSTSNASLKKLTESVVDSPRIKSTPPQTPRSLSNDGSGSEKHGPAPTSIPGICLESDSTTKENDRANSNGTDRGTSLTTQPGPVGPPKGKLAVFISEARGLKPSHDPYVVCIFELNEYISKGPQTRGSDSDHKGEGKHHTPRAKMMRIDSDLGKAMAIPSKSRQNSSTSLANHTIQSGLSDIKDSRLTTDPIWDHEAIFDVTGANSEIDVSIYDRSNQEAFLGHVRLSPTLSEGQSDVNGWFKLEPRGEGEEAVSGEIHLEMNFQKTDKKHYGPEDFKILKLIGKGTFGQVYQVRKKDTERIYAMKVLSKKVIVQKKEIAHTVGERNILVRTAMTDSPFIVGLKFSFQTPTDLYLVTDYMSGGELFWHLQKEGRFDEKRAKFYIAELILALQHLHQHDIVYRDLKPENILLDANGHIALCDFGLSKANLTKNDTTNTFCGTTEYLAPEVLLDEQGYTKMVDFWSLGVLVFEMCCGWSPFYAEDTQQMYKNIAFGKVRFPRDALSTEGRNFVKGLLNRNPKHRLGANTDAAELKEHPFFDDIDWDMLMRKNVVPPFKPLLKSPSDTSNFDPEFTNALNGNNSLNARAAALANGAMPASTPLSPGMQANFKGFTFVDESTMDEQFGGRGSDERDSDEDAMDEDRNDDDDDDDEFSPTVGARGGKGDRMSGIVKTGAQSEDSVFSHQNFDF